LIEEVIEEGINAKKQGDVEDDFFEVLHNFRCEYAFVDGNGIVGAVECVDIYVKKNQREDGKGHKGQNFPFGFVFFEDEINADEKEREKDHIVLEAEPDEKGEDKAEEQIVEGRKWAFLSYFTEQINGQKGDGDGRVEVKGKKENRGGKTVQKPEDKRHPFPLPEVIGEKKKLKSQENSPQRQTSLDYEDQQAPLEELAQSVKRQHQDGDPRLVDREDPLDSFLAEPAVFAQFDIGIKLFGVEMKVVLVVVVIGHIDILVLV
jgi:hypothetical protein